MLPEPRVEASWATLYGKLNDATALCASNHAHILLTMARFTQRSQNQYNHMFLLFIYSFFQIHKNDIDETFKRT